MTVAMTVKGLLGCDDVAVFRTEEGISSSHMHVCDDRWAASETVYYGLQYVLFSAILVLVCTKSMHVLGCFLRCQGIPADGRH